MRCIATLSLMMLVSVVHAQELVRDIVPGPEGSEVRGLLPVNGQIYFQAETQEFGKELWVSDGSEAGTRLVVDIQPGEASSGASPRASFLNTLYFATSDPLAFWRTNGSVDGTTKLVEFTGQYVQDVHVLHGHVLFKTIPGNGSELWYSNSTEAGTLRVTNFGGPVPDNIGDLITFQGAFYFTASHGGHDGALWKIEPPNIQPTLVFSDDLVHPFRLHSAENYIYVLGTQMGQDMEVWRSDGTLTGTEIVKTFSGGTHGTDARVMGSEGDRFYFTAHDGTHGYEPWVTDGTETGTTLLVDINPGLRRTAVWDGTPFNGDFFFAAGHDQYGSELRLTSGTPGTTRVFPDGNRSSFDRKINWLTNAGERLVYRADHPNTGKEVWVSNGIKGDAVVDVNPGEEGSDPDSFIHIGEMLYFSAKTPEHGRELWKLNLNSISVASEKLKPFERTNSTSVFPNPATLSVTIEYQLTEPADVRINLFDVLGKQVAQVQQQHRSVGAHSSRLEIVNLPSGVYFYVLNAGHRTETGKVIVVR